MTPRTPRHQNERNAASRAMEKFMNRIPRRRLLAATAAMAPLVSRLAVGQEPTKSAPAEPKSWTEFTPQSEKAVERGNDWLMKTMHRDGGCGVDIGQPTDIGCTKVGSWRALRRDLIRSLRATYDCHTPSASGPARCGRSQQATCRRDAPTRRARAYPVQRRPGRRSAGDRRHLSAARRSARR